MQRRAFVKDGTLLMMAAATASRAATPATPLVFGAFADAHFADRDPRMNRYYRHTLDKLTVAVERWNAMPDLAFVVGMGDLIDIGDGTLESDSASLRATAKVLAACRVPRHYVFGNHCIEILTKEEFAAILGCSPKAYSYDVGEWHFVCLDACFRKDGKAYSRHNSFHWQDCWIPQAQLDWLAADLAATSRPTIVFTHQRLDVKNPSHGVKNAAAVREIMEASGKVRAVFQGHSHKNDWELVNGIHYCVLRALCAGPGLSNNGFARITLAPDAISVAGFSRQSGYAWQT